MHVQLIRGLKFCFSIHLHPYFEYACDIEKLESLYYPILFCRNSTPEFHLPVCTIWQENSTFMTVIFLCWTFASMTWVKLKVILTLTNFLRFAISNYINLSQVILSDKSIAACTVHSVCLFVLPFLAPIFY